MKADDFDVIVVGSGAGGAAAAYRLVSGGLRVVLLEKGDHLPLDGSTLDVQRVVHEGQFLSREPWTDGSGGPLRPEEHFNVGGKTKWYGAALLRFGADEFGADDAHGCRAWPFGLQTLEPYYSEAERLLGVRIIEREPDLARILRRVAPQGGLWQAHEMPMGLATDIEHQPHEAAHFDGFASVQGLKGEADTSLLRQVKDNARFRLIAKAEVRSLLGVTGRPAIINGVVLTDGREFRARRVLLAAGAMHSPRILAAYLTAHDLQGRLPAAQNIGRNLKLHLLTAMVAVTVTPMTDLIRKTTFITNEEFPHSSVQPLGFDAELIASLMPKWLPSALGNRVGRHSYGFFLQTEDGSAPLNRVYDNPTPGAPPVLDYAEGRLPAALLEHRAFSRAFRNRLARAGLLAFTRRVGLNGTAHVCGSMICGESPQTSVVDAEGRVHGMHGLYVVDGSVLPRSSRVNPSLTIYAWALRCADRIIRYAEGVAQHEESVHAC